MSSLLGRSVTVGGITASIKEKIGEGGYAIVYRCQDSSGTEYALKHVNCLTPERYEQFRLEASILKSLPPHPNIVRLYASDEDPRTFVVNLLYEFCPATAISILSKRDLTRQEILVFFTACADATAFLHAQTPPIIHRDLKPENLLVALDGVPKLCDFGSATTKIYKIVKVEEINAASEDIERNTTQNYRSPEMIDLHSRVPVGTPSDVWALGCTLYKLIYRDDLYKPEERLPILQGKLRIRPGCDEAFAGILKDCIQTDVTKRKTAVQIAATARELRGDVTTIEIPKAAPAPEPQAARPAAPAAAAAQKGKAEGGAWWHNPLKYIQEQARTLVSTGVTQWAIKATFASGDPPPAKYVRRIVLASLRRTDLAPIAITEFLLNDRPWQTDPRVAAKSLYLILLLLQYENSLDEFIPITVKTDQIIATFAESQPPTNRFVIEAINGLANIVRSKVMLHATHKELQGNLAIGNGPAGDGLAADIGRYVTTITGPAAALLKAANQAKDFCLIVLAQPGVEELSNAVKLLQSQSRGASDPVLEKAQKVLEFAKKLPYIQSSVSFPDGSNDPPFSRFVINEEK
jgi:serine/threonine protein kinase